MELTETQYLQSIWQALRRIEDNLALPPAPLELPPITVTPPDLTEVVTAVTSLRPSATADDIARALADVLSPGTDGDTSDALRQVAEGLKTLDHRLQGFGKQAYGGGSAIIDKASVAAAGLAKETTLESLRADVADGISVTDQHSQSLTDAQLRASAVPVSGTGTFATKEVRAASPTQSSVAASITNVTLLAANTNRLGATVYNDAAAAVLFLKLGATASATSFTVKMAAGAYYELPFDYTGAVHGLWDVAAGNARITELVA